MSFFQALFIPLCLYINDIEVMAVVYSILLIIDISLNYKRHHKISYLDIWNIGFVYMASSEMILLSEILALQAYGLTVVRYIFVANVLFNIGFRIAPLLFNYRRRAKIYKKRYKTMGSGTKSVMLFLLFLAVLYFATNISYSFFVFESGRNTVLEDTVEGEINILAQIMRGISYFVAIAGAFYCRYYFNYKHLIYLFLIIFLCAAPQALFGTRYRLLFTLVAPVIVLFDRKKLSFKIITLGIVTLSVIIFISGFIRENRNSILISNAEIEKQGLIKQIASMGSAEGTIRRAEHLFRYVDTYGLHYGKESAFIIYFWVPRTFWPEKPTKIGHWLVNMYEYNLSRKFSAAYGFWGQLFIDFGYFSLAILFILGGVLRKLEMLKDWHLDNRSQVSILYVALFPVVFFSVRSPQTAVINFLMVVLVYMLIIYSFRFLKKFNLKIKLGHSA